MIPGFSAVGFQRYRWYDRYASLRNLVAATCHLPCTESTRFLTFSADSKLVRPPKLRMSGSFRQLYVTSTCCPCLGCNDVLPKSSRSRNGLVKVPSNVRNRSTRLAGALDTLPAMTVLSRSCRFSSYEPKNCILFFTMGPPSEAPHCHLSYVGFGVIFPLMRRPVESRTIVSFSTRLLSW